MSHHHHIVVIGAVNLDIKGKSFKTMIPHTSNPGKVEISAGGVGRNIAENLARLGVKTTLISSLSKDPFSRFLVEETEKAGVSCQHCIVTDQYPSSLFVAFMNNRGDLMSAISDMSILNAITPDFLKTKTDILKTATHFILDADIPQESLDFILNLGQQENIPVCVEPVSEEKAEKLLPFLDRISIITPNREEASVLAGLPIEGTKGVIRCGDAILERGVKHVVITLGAEGVYYASQDLKRFISSISTVVADSVGAGDSLVAGTMYGLVNGESWYESIRLGIATATLTLNTTLAVHNELNPQAIRNILNEKWWQ